MTVDGFTNDGWDSVEQCGAPLFSHPTLFYLSDNVQLQGTFLTRNHFSISLCSEFGLQNCCLSRNCSHHHTCTTCEEPAIKLTNFFFIKRSSLQKSHFTTSICALQYVLLPFENAPGGNYYYGADSMMDAGALQTFPGFLQRGNIPN